MRQTLRLGKKQKVFKFGFHLLVSNAPGAPFRAVGGVHASRFQAEQYFHQNVATSVTTKQYRIEGVRGNVDPTPFQKFQRSEPGFA